MDNSILATLEQDKANLIKNYEALQQRYTGAIEYVDGLIARIRAQGVNGAAPVVKEAAPVTPPGGE